MPVATMEAWEAASRAPLLELWGMTELAGLGTAHALYAPNRLGSIGVAAPGVDVRVGDLVDPARTCDPDEPGELMVRGPITMLGYFGNPSATADVLATTAGCAPATSRWSARTATSRWSIAART